MRKQSPYLIILKDFLSFLDKVFWKGVAILALAIAYNFAQDIYEFNHYEAAFMKWYAQHEIQSDLNSST